MAFPVSGAVQNSGAPLTPDQLQGLRQPNQLQKLRQVFLNKLFTQQAVSPNLERGVPQQLAQIAQILGRSAGNEPTVYDNGSFRSSASGNANLLSQQVERALTQVLGRSPGRGPDGFISALNSAFPTATDGKVITTPTRSVVSLTSNGNYSTAANGNGLGQLSVEQANLYRQASLIAADALRVLEGLQSFEPTADADAVEALRALVRSQINTLVEEFGRLDEPRKERVETYLNTLYTADGNSGYLRQMGEQARLIARSGANGSVAEVFPVTLADETQVAGYELLKNYAVTLRTIWNQYATTTDVEKTVTGRYSERLSRASIMVPVIADSNTSFMAAMDSIGFTASERRSDAALFSTLGSPQQLSDDSNPSNPNAFINSITLSLGPILDISVIVPLPDMTVNDFNEWVDRFTTIEAPSILSTSGQFGLDFVTDQADTLFWVMSFVLFAIQPGSNSTTGLLLDKVLSFERVKQTLSELVFQLDTLADLGVGSTSPPITGAISNTFGSVIPS